MKKKLILLAFLGIAILACTPSVHAALVLDYESANFNATTGTWVDASSSANNALANDSSYKLSLATNATPTGASAVDFSGNNTTANSYYLKLNAALTSAAFTTSPSLTLFFVAKVKASVSDSETLIGGGYPSGTAGPATVYLGTDGRWVFGSASKAVVAISTTNYPSGWGIFAVTYNGTNATLYYNGAVVGTSSVAATFTGISLIGYGSTWAQDFTGQLAAVKVYDTTMSSVEVSAEYTSLANIYLAVPEPSTWAMVAAGTGMMGCVRRARYRRNRME